MGKGLEGTTCNSATNRPSLISRKIDNDLVRNTLIINQGIEQTVLIPKRSDALEWRASARPAGQSQIPRVRRIFTFNDDRSPGGRSLSYTGTGQEDFGYIEPWNGGARMQTDMEAQILYANSSSLFVPS